MLSGFSTKKIKSEKTLGEKLKFIRQKRKISLNEAETGSKVRAKYLAAIEQGRWRDLPQSVYTRGFVLAYAKFLNLDPEAIAEQYELELKFRNKKEDQKISYNQSVKETKVLITPKLLAYTGLALSIFAMVTYIIYQLFSFAGAPGLKIVSPENNSTFDNDAIELAGITDVDTSISVNDENIPVSNDGRFLAKLKLHKGVNVVRVRAVNKAKKESSSVYTIEYKPKTAAIESSVNQ